MAHSTILFKNSFGEMKTAPVGFSWTSFFFGWIVPVFRADWKNFAIWLGLSILVALLTAGLGTIIVPIVQAFIYNKWYIKDLVKAGYTVENVMSTKTIDVLSAEVGINLKRGDASVTQSPA